MYAIQPVVSLEQDPYWARRVNAALRWHRLRDVRVIYAPIREYAGFDWYTVPFGMPKGFGLVVCDGPVSHQEDGAPRYGLMPIMSERIKGASILLDDIDRSTEELALERWEREFGVEVYAPNIASRNLELSRWGLRASRIDWQI